MIDLGLWSPRIGATYALDDTGRTLLRASYGMFGSQLGSGTVQGFSAASLAVLIYSATDRNGNNVADPGELDELESTGRAWNPEHPASGLNFNRVAIRTSKSPKTHELVIGIDRQPRPTSGSARPLTWRRFNDVIWSRHRLDHGQHRLSARRDHSCRLRPGRHGRRAMCRRSAPTARPTTRRGPKACRSATVRNTATGRIITSDLSGSKCRPPSACRTGGWDGSASRPTRTGRTLDDTSTAVQDPTPSTTWPNIEGGAYVTQTNGSGKSEIYLLLPRYQFTASGAYQLPYRINIAGSVVAREGFGQPYSRRWSQRSRAAGEAGAPGRSGRQPPARCHLDLRAEKGFAFRGGSQLMLTMDMFNVFNASTTLGRQYDVTATGSTGFNKTLEIMNPRLIRLGEMWFQSSLISSTPNSKGRTFEQWGGNNRTSCLVRLCPAVRRVPLGSWKWELGV